MDAEQRVNLTADGTVAFQEIQHTERRSRGEVRASFWQRFDGSEDCTEAMATRCALMLLISARLLVEGATGRRNAITWTATAFLLTAEWSSKRRTMAPGSRTKAIRGAPHGSAPVTGRAATQCERLFLVATSTSSCSAK